MAVTDTERTGRVWRDFDSEPGWVIKHYPDGRVKRYQRTRDLTLKDLVRLGLDFTPVGQVVSLLEIASGAEVLTGRRLNKPETVVGGFLAATQLLIR